MRFRIPLIALACAAVGILVYVMVGAPGSRDGSRSTPATPGAESPAADTGTAKSPESEVSDAAHAAVRVGAAQGKPQQPPVDGESLTGVGRSYSGRVVDVRGAPVADGTIYLAPGDRSGETPLENLDPQDLPWARRAEARTNARGEFQIAPLAAGTLRLAVRAQHFAPQEQTVSDAHELGDLVLQDGVVLSGRVLDPARAPIAGAILRRLDSDARPAALLGNWAGDIVATSAADGTFHADQIASGPWLMSIRAEGRPDKLERGATARPGEVVSGLEFVLEDGAEIRGKVVQAPPAVLANLWVRAVPVNESGGGRLYAGEHVDEARFLVVTRGAHCAPDGTFSVRGLTRDTRYTISAREGESDFFGRVRTQSVVARAGTEGIDLVFTPETALVFRVVDASTAAPVTEFEVRAGSSFLTPIADDHGGIQRNFPDGRVRFAHGLEGHGSEPIRLVVAARGYEILRVAGVHVVAQSDVDLGTLKLVPVPSILVRVTSAATGDPVPDARVSLRASGANPQPTTGDQRATPSSEDVDLHSAITDRDGLARVNRLPGASARLSVQHADFAPLEREIGDSISARAPEELVQLGGGGNVVVEVRDSSGALVRDACILHRGPRAETFVAQSEREPVHTNARGQLEFTHLEAGVHTFQVDDRNDSTGSTARGPSGLPDAAASRLDSTSTARASVTVTEGGRHEVDLVVAARVRLTGRVTENGQALAGATLQFAASGPAPSAGATRLDSRSNGAGDYVLVSIEPGRYRVRIAHPSRVMDFERDVSIGPVATRADFELPLTTLQGVVLDEHNAPLAGVRVRVARANPSAEPRGSESVGALGSDDPIAQSNARTELASTASVASAADGTFALRGVSSDADLIVIAESPDHQPASSEPIRAVSGRVRAGIELHLRRGAALDVVVVRADGIPARGCRVEAAIEAGSALSGTTGADGSVRFVGMAPGKWRVRVARIEGRSVVDAQNTGAELPAERVLDVRLDAANKLEFVLR